MKYDSFKHHRRSIRLKGYDYSSKGLYYITICSLGRECLFSSLSVGAGLAPAHNDVSDHTYNDASSLDPLDFKLTRIGEILDNQWNKIPSYFRNVILDEYVIMPNHFHGILIIGGGQHVTRDLAGDVSNISENTNVTGSSPASGRAPARGAPTTLGSIIGAFKSRCVNENLKYIEENGLNELGKFWQRNYYERIIRNHNELDEIRNYIQENPVNWLMDEENPNS